MIERFFDIWCTVWGVVGLVGVASGILIYVAAYTNHLIGFSYWIYLCATNPATTTKEKILKISRFVRKYIFSLDSYCDNSTVIRFRNGVEYHGFYFKKGPRS